MKLFKLIASLVGLGSASSKAGYVEEVATPGGTGNTRYLAHSNGTDWIGLSVVHKGTFANLPSPSTVPINSRAWVTDVLDDRGAGPTLYQNTGTAWRRAYDDGSLPITSAAGMVFNNTIVTTPVQGLLDQAYNSTSLAGYDYGRGKEIVLPPGVVRTGPLTMSAYTSFYGAAPGGGAVIKFNHTGVTSPTAMITQRGDANQQHSIAPNPSFKNVFLEGDKGNATTTVHGYWAPERLDGEKEDCPYFNQVQVLSFSGDGFRIEKNHRQVRAINFKSIANNGWGYYLDHNSDSKMIQLGIGRNLQGQIYMNDCASPNFSQFDVWTPGGFQGLWTVYIISCRNVAFSQGQIEGRMSIEGGNFDSNDKTHYQVTNTTFTDFNFKVDPDIYLGTQYVGGGGSTQYDSLVNIKGADAVKFTNGAFGFGQGDPSLDTNGWPPEVWPEAVPKYIFKFIVPNGQPADGAGYVELSSVDFIHMRKQADGTAPIIPFTVHWADDPSRVIFRDGTGPGQPQLLNKAAVTCNYVPADGRTLTTADYPLLYLGRDFGLSWASGGKPATFTVQDMSGVPVPNGMGYYIRVF